MHDLLKAMLTPLPTALAIGAKTQKAVVQFFLKSMLHSGKPIHIMGHATAQARNTPPVPNRCCNGVKASSVQRACEIPASAMKSDIWKLLKPKPPSFASVNWKIDDTRKS